MFSRFRGFFSQEEVTSMQLESIQAGPGLYLRVIVNEKPLNIAKTTFSVLSVLYLIYCPNIFSQLCTFVRNIFFSRINFFFSIFLELEEKLLKS